jgi:hypothetical protein
MTARGMLDSKGTLYLHVKVGAPAGTIFGER